MRFRTSLAFSYRLGANLLLLLLSTVALAQLSVPTFGTRGGVPPELVERFMTSFRSAVGAATGLEVHNGELITPGIAGSLEPEFAMLIAELDGARYAISGELALSPNADGEPYAVNIIVVDAERGRSTDLITRPLDPAFLNVTVTDVASAVAAFTSAKVELPHGDAGLFVSSEPAEAQVFVDDVSIGRTGQIDVAMLSAGRYQLEVRKAGFLPEVRTIELRGGDTSFVHIVLTAISGGSIQVGATPRATVVLDGIPSGSTPVTLPALPGTHQVTLQRPGFRDETYDVLVRNYRVTRLDTELTPAVDPLLFWDERREVLVFIDGVLQPGAYAVDLKPGLHTIELVGDGATRSYLRAVPSNGVYRLDLLNGELQPLLP